MIYPPGWTTLPVTIFSLTDRGNIADGSALTIVLVGVTLLLMIKRTHRPPDEPEVISGSFANHLSQW